MPRLSREESQQLTRQKLIEAAEAEILRSGIYEASIRRICDSAGFTLGAFYSNFADKDELLLEVVEVQTRRELEHLKSLASASVSLDRESVLNEIARWLKELQKNEIHSSLLLEFEVYGSHNPGFKKRYDQNKVQWHSMVANVVEMLFKGQNLQPQIPPIQMAVGLSALWSGFVIEGKVSPGGTADKLIMVFLGALLKSASPTRKSKN